MPAAQTGPEARTLAEKIIARAAGRDTVRPGEIVTCRVDLAMVHDSSGPRRFKDKLQRLGVGPWDPDKLVVITDHYLSEDDRATRDILSLTRDWVAEHGVGNFHDGEGICHIVLAERGYLRPGMFCVGADSHSTTAGALGCFMAGIGATEMAGVIATGEIWVRVPETRRVIVSGTLGPGVAAKDVILRLCGEIGIMGANYQAVEYTGSAVAAMPQQDRMTLTNMAAELGAKTGLIAPDEKTMAYLSALGVEDADAARWCSDPAAPVAAQMEIDGHTLAPQVAAPASPENAAPVTDALGTRLDQAYIGACTGAKLSDLRMAAAVLNGRHVRIPLYVAPASVRDAEAARADGTLAILEDAGAEILVSACGACIGLGPARLGAGKRQISTTSRNFTGRMGDPTSETWLSSAYTAAASAVAGEIADPREIAPEEHP